MAVPVSMAFVGKKEGRNEVELEMEVKWKGMKEMGVEESMTNMLLLAILVVLLLIWERMPKDKPYSQRKLEEAMERDRREREKNEENRS
ncbi:hypothetical protein HGI30_02250 [Paenibacillus albicereus]|uniref:Uncharacterized protein n=1 Tax=Paenibacillus albicereus TaxID=2726185 RepID=A0A6H2GT46_9BACL|nr:hypothetical protein [Paenibacillus albicereus]QJC50529.1 hypothetical protein HGI30_02250 [Paenibacillus albicereus]